MQKRTQAAASPARLTLPFRPHFFFCFSFRPLLCPPSPPSPAPSSSSSSPHARTAERRRETGGEDRISTESSRAPPRYTPSARSPTGESHLSAGPAWTSQRPRGGLSQFRFGSPAAPCCWPSPHVLGRYLRGPLPDHRRRWQMMAEDVGRPARVAQTGRACSRRHDRAQSPMNDVHHTQSPRGLRARGRVSFVLVVVVLEMAISGAAPVLAVSPLLLASSGFASESLLLRKYGSMSPLSFAPPEAVCASRSVPALRKHMTHVSCKPSPARHTQVQVLTPSGLSEYWMCCILHTGAGHDGARRSRDLWAQRRIWTSRRSRGAGNPDRRHPASLRH